MDDDRRSDDPRKTFGAQLKAWREARGLSQAEVDAQVGKARGFTAQVETGRLKPPPMDVCDLYDAALGLPVGETWEVAAPARMIDADPELYSWHRAKLDAARGFELTAEEEEVIRWVRFIQAEIDELPTTIWGLDEIQTEDWDPDGTLTSLGVATAVSRWLEYVLGNAARNPATGEMVDGDIRRHVLTKLRRVLVAPLELTERNRLVFDAAVDAILTVLLNASRQEKGP